MMKFCFPKFPTPSAADQLADMSPLADTGEQTIGDRLGTDTREQL